MKASADESRSADEVRFVDIEDARLEVHRYAGSAAAHHPVLVFLHEGLGSASMWRDFPGRLATATGSAAVVYSRRGYGRSSRRDGPYDVDFMHREAQETLPRLLVALDIERPVLIGHSDGGSIALIHAADHPVAGLIVEAPHIFVEDICIEAIREARDSFEESRSAERLARHHDDPVHAFRGWNDIWLEPAFRDWNIETVLPRLQCPILAIQGESDQYGTMAQIDGIAEKAGCAVDLLKIPDCGHSPHRDQPRKVLRAMTDFIKALGTEAVVRQSDQRRYLEDYAEGEVIVSRPYPLGRREILTFARAYDPQPMHIDEQFAATGGPFRDIIASGFQTVALAFRLFAEAGFFDGDVALGGPGMDDVRWLTPVYPDDVLTNHITVVEARRSESKPDRGILRLAHDLRNQHGDSVMTCVTASMIRARTHP